MSNGRIKFELCIQKKQYLAAGDRSMMDARVFFVLSVDGSKPMNLFVDIMHPYGTDFESIEFEVSSPVKHMGDYVPYSDPYNHTIYKGPFNHKAFSENVEKAYRSLIGSTGSGIRIQGSSNVTMRNNSFQMNQSFEMQLGETGPGPW